MSAEDKLKATAKNLEGKAQEIIGTATDDPEMQLEGKAKQVQAAGMKMAENVKDKAKEVLESIKDQIDKV